MSNEAEAIYQAVLQLPQAERVELVGRLRGGDQPILDRTLEQQILELTKAMFAGDVAVENSADPEFPATIYVVFRVARAERAADEESIDRELLWHRQVSKIAPEAQSRIRLLTE